MSSCMHYFKHRLFSTWHRIPILSLLSMLVIHVAVNNQRMAEYQYESLAAVAIVLGILFSILPLLELSCFKNRRNVDTLFSSPVGRRHMALCHYLCGLAEATAAYVLAYLFYVVRLAPYANTLHLPVLIPYFFVSLGLGICIYTVISFVYSQGNSVIDGIVFVVCYIFIFYLMALTVEHMIPVCDCGESHMFMIGDVPLQRAISAFLLYAPLDHITSGYMHMMAPHGFGHYVMELAPSWFLILNQVLLTAGSLTGYLVYYGRYRAEQAGAISNSWFGYRVLIPLFAFCLLSTDFMGSPTMSLLVFVAVAIGYFSYRRSFKLKTSDLVVIGILFLFFLYVYRYSFHLIFN